MSRYISLVSAICVTVSATAVAQQDEPSEGLRLRSVHVTDRQPEDPGNYAAVDAEYIDRLRADHPAEIINALPGVSVQMNSGQENLISIRSPVLNGGAGQGSFLIIENRIPIRAPAFGNVNALMEVLHENADLIEVIRGPGSARYGSNAVHGLIGFTLPEPSSQAAYRARLGASSLNRYYVDARGEGLAPGVRSSYSLSSQRDGGWRDSAELWLNKAHAALGWNAGSWEATTFVSVMALAQQTAGFLVGEDAYMSEETARSNPNPDAYRNASAVRGHVRAKRDIGGGQLSVTPFFIYQRSDFSQHYLPYNGVETNNHDSIGLNLSHEGQSGALSWIVGAVGQWADGTLIENQPEAFGFFPGDSRFPQGDHYKYRVRTLTGAAYFETIWELTDRMRLLAGLRAETHRYDYTSELDPGDRGRFRIAADRQDDFLLLLPKAGLTYTITDGLDLYANYARGGRSPQASDLYRLQTLQEVGEVRPESADSFEIGARGQLSGIASYDVSAYSMDKRDYFFRDSNGLNVPEGITRHQGIEAGLEVIAGSLTARAALSWAIHTYQFDRTVTSETESIGKGNRIDTAPEWLADLGVRYDAGRLSVTVDLDYIGSYFTDAANLHSYPGHTLIGMGAELDLSDNSVLYASVRNLLDARYADRADFAFGSERYFPGEPRTISLGMRFKR